MGRKRQQAVQDQPPQEAEAIPPYQLEPLTDDLRSRLNVWGNSTKLAISQLESDAPGWAQMMTDIFNVIAAAIQEQSQ